MLSSFLSSSYVFLNFFRRSTFLGPFQCMVIFIYILDVIFILNNYDVIFLLKFFFTFGVFLISQFIFIFMINFLLKVAYIVLYYQTFVLGLGVDFILPL